MKQNSGKVTTQIALANVFQTVSCATAVQPPPMPYMKRSIPRARHKNEAVVSTNKTLVDLVI